MHLQFVLPIALFLKEFEQEEILQCFIRSQVELNSNDFILTNENVFNITPFISF